MASKETSAETHTLAAENVSLQYTDGERTTYALHDVSVTLAPGRFYGIMGPSGSGKSSLLYILSGLKKATGGRARFGDFDFNANTERATTALRRAHFGFVFQQPFLLPYLTAYENVVVAAKDGEPDAKDKAITFLRELGLGGQENKIPAQLSGGEKQRVSIARAMMNDPRIIFADEPTAALDRGNGMNVIEILAQWRTRGSVVVVTHDPEMVKDADEVIVLRDGRLYEAMRDHVPI